MLSTRGRSSCGRWVKIHPKDGKNQRHSLLRLNGRPPEHGSKVICANVEITSADVHTTDDVQTFLVDAKLMRSEASAGGIHSAKHPRIGGRYLANGKNNQHNSPYLQNQKKHNKKLAKRTMGQKRNGPE